MKILVKMKFYRERTQRKKNQTQNKENKKTKNLK
jgi:hypothetical protein